MDPDWLIAVRPDDPVDETGVYPWSVTVTLFDEEGEPLAAPETASGVAQFSLDSNTMRVVATGRDPRSPALLANATADAFLAYRKQMSAQSLNEARSVLRQGRFRFRNHPARR